MQFLLHTDTVIEAIKVGSGPVLSLCREKRMDAWVLSAAVPIIHSQLRQTMEGARARKVLEDFLAHVTLLLVTGTDISATLAGNGLGFMEALSVTAAKGFQLAGVVTLSPDRFRNAGIHTLKPKALVKFIQSGEPSVDKVPLLNIPTTLPEILPELEFDGSRHRPQRRSHHHPFTFFATVGSIPRTGARPGHWFRIQEPAHRFHG